MVRIVPTFGLIAFNILLMNIAAADRPDIGSLQVPAYAPDRILVKFNPGATASEVGAAHRKAGGLTLKTIHGIGVQVVKIPAGSVRGKLKMYQSNPNVEYAEPDYYRALVIPEEEPGPTLAGGANYFEEQWYLHNTGQTHTTVQQTLLGPTYNTTWGTEDADINAPQAWDINKGAETTSATDYNTAKVAVLDSGADCYTLELQGKCLEQVSLVGLNPGVWGLDNCSEAEPACDNYGHGTFVASEIAANTDNGEGIAGAAWNTGVGIFKVCYQEIITDGVNVYAVGLCPLSASVEAVMLAASDQSMTRTIC